MTKNTITTYTKKQVDTMNPKKEDIVIEDIAHALSMMTRAGGHFPEFFSVAEHCIQCCKEAMARNYNAYLCLICLLHDGTEAYLADVTRPVKQNMTMYIQIENQLMDVIFEKFLGKVPTEQELSFMKNIDDTCLYYEFLHYMDEKLSEEEPLMISTPTYGEKTMKEVEQEYLELFQKLVQEVGMMNE